MALSIVLSTFIPTAFAKGVTFSSADPSAVLSPNIISVNPAFTYFQAGHNFYTADSSVGGSVAASAAPSVSNAVISTTNPETVDTAAIVPPAAVEDQAPVIISDIRSSLISSDNIPAVVVGQEIANYALQYNGYSYVYGASSPSAGFDCSGLAYYVYGQFGYALPRTAAAQYQEGTPIERSDLQPGDLLFFATAGGRYVSHVGIYIGNDQFINAATTNQGVIISSLDNTYWTDAYVGAKQIFSSQSQPRPQ